MSEWSKKIGEYGEEVTEKFLEIIGWIHPEKGLDIDCSDPQKHKLASSKSDRKKHGLDFLHYQTSPFFDHTLDIHCISSKYKAEKYPSSPINDFKNHLIDLATTMECFEKSNELKEIKKDLGGRARKVRISGILIWLHSNKSGREYDDLLEEVSKIQLPSDVKFKHPIYLVDNKQANFIYSCHQFMKLNYPNQKISYFYQKTGNNNTATTERFFSGCQLPVNLITSGIYIFKAEDTSIQKNSLCFITNTPFSKDNLDKIIGLAHDISQDLSSNITIAFEDYNALYNKNDVSKALLGFSDDSFTKKITITNINQNGAG
ncbi:hypothetical protein NBRC116188_27330 [Oceaniserpentilla sp. 4NH20-0058]|uniref:GapS4a family protein n=1 Tax=Oceaniserpentilla sp. 4NH20-0058 TaxID=3127660 RepID=UPI003107E404